MKFDNSLLTSFLDDCNIEYQVEEDVVAFEYDGRCLFGYVYNPEYAGDDDEEYGFVAGLALILPEIHQVAPFDVKKYLKLINKLNADINVAKYVLDDNNIIHISVAVPLDSSPEMDDLIPGLVRVLVAAHNAFMEADK